MTNDVDQDERAFFGRRKGKALRDGQSHLIEHTLPRPADLGFHIAFAAAGISGVLIANPRYHEFLAGVAACAIFAYIAFLFEHLA